jgi:hypothetical protein
MQTSTICQGLALATLLTLVGCGGSDMAKVVVRGKVAYQGNPVANGQILFYPTDETPGPVSGATIKDGEFTADSKGGVPVGKHRVEIRAFDLEQPAEKEAQPEGERQYQPRRQYLPAKYNSKSTLLVTVPAENKFEHDFELK